MYQKTVQYPVNHSVVRMKQIVIGTTHLSNYTVVNGQIPRLIICAMVKSTSFTGRYDTNPSLFTNQNINSAQMQVNGMLYPPLPNKAKESMLEAYLNSLRMVRKIFSDNDSTITFDNLREDDGYRILSFDFMPEECDGNRSKEN